MPVVSIVSEFLHVEEKLPLVADILLYILPGAVEESGLVIGHWYLIINCHHQIKERDAHIHCLVAWSLFRPESLIMMGINIME